MGAIAASRAQRVHITCCPEIFACPVRTFRACCSPFTVFIQSILMLVSHLGGAMRQILCRWALQLPWRECDASRTPCPELNQGPEHNRLFREQDISTLVGGQMFAYTVCRGIGSDVGRAARPCRSRWLVRPTVVYYCTLTLTPKP